MFSSQLVMQIFCINERERGVDLLSTSCERKVEAETAEVQEIAEKSNETFGRDTAVVKMQLREGVSNS